MLRKVVRILLLTQYSMLLSWLEYFTFIIEYGSLYATASKIDTDNNAIIESKSARARESFTNACLVFFFKTATDAITNELAMIESIDKEKCMIM